MTPFRTLGAGFLQLFRDTPILRIGVAAAMLVAASGCDKLGLGGDPNPAAPSPPPTAGSSITYAAIGASDANGVGSSVPCLPFDQQCPGMGYVYVAARQLRTQGFNVTLLNLGVATAV